MAQQINLYNPDLEDNRELWSVRGAAIGWAVVLALAALWGAYAQYSLATAQKQQRDLAAQAVSAQAETQKLSALISARKGDPAMAAEISTLELDVKGRQEIMGVLQGGGLGDTRGFSEHLRAFARQSFEGMWLTELKISAGGRDMSIEGRALQAGYVPNYLRRLNGESVMQGHAFSELMIQLPKPDVAEKAASKPSFVEFRLSAAPFSEVRKTGTQ